MKTLYRLLLSFLLTSAASGAQAGATLPLEAGTYIQGTAAMACADAANAGTLYFDGKNLQGPHLAACRTAIRSVTRDGKTFTSASTCDEHDKDGHAVKETVQRTLTISDRTHFQELTSGAAPGDFHRCGAYPAS